MQIASSRRERNGGGGGGRSDRGLYYAIHLSFAKIDRPKFVHPALNQRKAIKAERLINLASRVRILMTKTRAYELKADD